MLHRPVLLNMAKQSLMSGRLPHGVTRHWVHLQHTHWESIHLLKGLLALLYLTKDKTERHPGGNNPNQNKAQTV